MGKTRLFSDTVQLWGRQTDVFVNPPYRAYCAAHTCKVAELRLHRRVRRGNRPPRAMIFKENLLADGSFPGVTLDAKDDVPN